MKSQDLSESGAQRSDHESHRQPPVAEGPPDQQTEEIRRLLEAEHRQRLVAEELHAVAQQITAVESLDDALAAVLRAVDKMFGATSASILLLDPSGVTPNRRFTTRHTGQPHWDDHVSVRPHGITMNVLRTGQPVVVEDAQSEPRPQDVGRNAQGTYAAVPLRHRERVIGVLFVDWDERRTYGASDLRLLQTLAAYGAIAVEHARLHARDRALRLETEEARVRLQEFLGMVAHDLRGPLGVVATSLELLRESKRRNRAEVEHHVLPATENAIRRMRRLVDDLLGAARIGAGRFHVRPFPMDLVDIARRVVDQHQTVSDRHRVTLETPERLEGEWDPERIGQLLTNLISNAIKYSPDGGEVRVGVWSDQDEVLVQVTDQGTGFDPAQTALLFEPFVRLHQETEIDGLGLGLYIAKAIAEAHGGRIWVDSQPGQGASFFVALPYAVPPPPSP